MAANNPDKCLITFWGTRGSIPTPGRATEKYGGNTPCVSARHGDHIVIFDAGTGIRGLGLELADEIATKQEALPIYLFLSHTHWDHIQGLPFFTPVYIPETHLTIFGSANAGGPLSEVLMGQMNPTYFPIDMSNLAANIAVHELKEQTITVGQMQVSWQQQLFHPGGTVRYALEIDGKKFVYASDVELDFAFDPDNPSEDAAKAAQEYLDFVAGADLLIADGQYTDSEYESKKGWGHTSLSVLFDAAHRAKVKKLAVFHHEPLFSDSYIDQLYAQYGRKYYEADPPMKIFWSREGTTLSL
ncbi:MBL fold metallo-hydrolase [Oligoflexia bacterium]|nr:MBL fold metallo-hydrolase [Oligoflexia bacterium]